MALTNKTIASSYGDILQVDNNGSGRTANGTNIKDGLGNSTSLTLGSNKAHIKPSSDQTDAFLVENASGDDIFVVDATNKEAKVNGHYVNTQFKTFGVYDISPTAGNHYPLISSPSIYALGGSTHTSPSFGTGTDPDDSFTTANTDTQYAAQIVPMMWRIPDNISIDSVSHIEGASSASGDTTRMHLKSFDFTSGSTSALTNGTLLAHSSDITNDGNEQAYLANWTVDSASVTAGKVILCFFRSDSVNSDYSINVTVKYHLT